MHRRNSLKDVMKNCNNLPYFKALAHVFQIILCSFFLKTRYLSAYSAMKELFKLGYLTNDYHYTDSTGNLAGPAVSVFKEVFYFVVDKFNVSYQELDPKLARCLGDDCSYPIRMLEEKVYLIAGLPSLPRLFPNITSGPPLFVIQCFILTVPDTKEGYQNRSFMNVYNELGFYSIGSLILVSILLIYAITCRNSWNFDSSAWESFKIVVRNSTSALETTDKFFWLQMVIFFAFINLFFNLSIQTNMVKKKDFAPVETFDDMLNQNLSPMFAAYDCESLIRLIPQRTMRERILRKSISLPEKPDPLSFEREIMRLKSKFCLVVKREELSMLLHLGCSLKGTKLLRRKYIYSSSKPILTQIASNYLSKHTPSSVLKTFTETAYDAFEMKIFYEPVSPRLAKLFVRETDVKCANEEAIYKQASFSSLDMTFFTYSFCLYSIGLLIALSIFVMEFLKSPIVSNFFGIGRLWGIKFSTSDGIRDRHGQNKQQNFSVNMKCSHKSINSQK